MGKHRWSWGNYLLNRATRLYVALIPALILTVTFDHIARTHGGMNLGYGPQSMKDFWGSLFFLQGIYTKPYGSDGPLWSLSYEFWFYILFPLIALLAKRAPAGSCSTSHSSLRLHSSSTGQFSCSFPSGCWASEPSSWRISIRTRPAPCAQPLCWHRWS